MATIWVDADACPVPIKEILYRAAHRTQVLVIFIANQWLKVAPSPFIRFVQVPSGFDVADHYIVEHVKEFDLVVTADIPLAALVIDKGCQVLTPRGEWYTKANIAAALTIRNFLTQLRDSGVQTGGPASLSMQDRQHFANRLDQWLIQPK